MEEQSKLNEYRRDLKVRILVESTNKFREKGIKSVKMDDIAHSLGISKRTLYELYPNKETLLLESLKYSSESSKDNIHRELGDNHNVMDVIFYIYRHQLEVLSNISPAFYDEISNYPKVKEYILSKRKERKKDSEMFFNKGIEEGYFMPGYNSDILFELSNAVSDSISKERLYKQYSPDELFKHVVMMFIRGFCTQKGVQEMDRIMGNV